MAKGKFTEPEVEIEISDCVVPNELSEGVALPNIVGIKPEDILSGRVTISYPDSDEPAPDPKTRQELDDAAFIAEPPDAETRLRRAEIVARIRKAENK